ncbi:zinc finger CCCH domain-containing protein 42 [Hyaloraphidium curvatum]|nr:zinc finger CCCH domain-containing protein 42 [Hyaloraphidium curvatum]
MIPFESRKFTSFFSARCGDEVSQRRIQSTALRLIGRALCRSVVKEIQKINERELQLGLTGQGGSYHDDYKDSAYIFVGNLDYELTEGDVITIFSQYGEIVDVNLVRDKGTGKSKGFAFVAYEDQRSTVLAVDNFNGTKLLGRTLRVDHTKNYREPKKGSDDEEEEEPKPRIAPLGILPGDEKLIAEQAKAAGKKDSDEESIDIDVADLDPEDPMYDFLVAERKKKLKKERGKRKKEKKEKKEKKDKVTDKRSDLPKAMPKREDSPPRERHRDYGKLATEDKASQRRPEQFSSSDRRDDRRVDRPDDRRDRPSDGYRDSGRRDNGRDDRGRWEDDRRHETRRHDSGDRRSRSRSRDRRREDFRRPEGPDRPYRDRSRDVRDRYERRRSRSRSPRR